MTARKHHGRLRTVNARDIEIVEAATACATRLRRCLDAAFEELQHLDWSPSVTDHAHSGLDDALTDAYVAVEALEEELRSAS
jgi:hypothetical protein